jgi:Outer membrane protein beta-barrel domain
LLARKHRFATERHLIALVFSLTVAWPVAASADWFITPLIGAKFKGSTSIVNLDQGASNTRLTFGVSATILSDEIFGVEAEFGYSPRFFERSSGMLVARSNVLTLTGNVIAAIPKSITRESLRPYAVGGVGLMHVGIADVADVFPVDTNLLGVTFGGGAIGRLTNHASLRFEVRHFRNLTRDETDVVSIGPTRLSFWRATVGVALHSTLF